MQTVGPKPQPTESVESVARAKANRLLSAQPDAVPMTAQWLAEQGITPQQLMRYRAAGWLESPSKGLWQRVGQRITWQGAVQALQQQLQIKVWPAARTALELTGQAHYIPMSDTPQLQLCLGADQRLPRWFRALPATRNLSTFRGETLLQPEYVGLVAWKSTGAELEISSTERALLELCHLLPDKADAEEVGQLALGLPSLRPEKISQLLKICQSIKAKRLFMVLVRRVNHGWSRQLDVQDVDFGRGKRSLKGGGKLDPEYQITVPLAWQEL